MMRKRIAVVAAAVLVACVAVYAAAQEWHHGGPHPRHHGMLDAEHVEHLTRALGLTDAQASELKTFLEAERPAIEAIHRRMEETHIQLEAATANGRFDEAQVRAIAAQQGQAHADMVVEHERCKAKVYSVLTAEQRAKLEEMHRQHGPMKRRGPGGPPPAQ